MRRDRDRRSVRIHEEPACAFVPDREAPVQLVDLPREGVVGPRIPREQRFGAHVGFAPAVLRDDETTTEGRRRPQQSEGKIRPYLEAVRGQGLGAGGRVVRLRGPSIRPGCTGAAGVVLPMV